jgi:hypothetical protein
VEAEAEAVAAPLVVGGEVAVEENFPVPTIMRITMSA